MNADSYKIWRIPKRDGGHRVIAEPLPDLKKKQKAILKWLISRGIRASPYAHGFVRGRSTATHARLHAGRKSVLKVDLKDCFGSTKKRLVYNALHKEGIKHETCMEIIEACSLDGSLPQGAPTSPFLVNLALKEMDFRLAGLAKKNILKMEVVYSRYADDLAFSCDDESINHLLPAIDRIVGECGYTLNPKKTRIMRQGRRQEVT
jgi:RNA-directed DNA polymerase